MEEGTCSWEQEKEESVKLFQPQYYSKALNFRSQGSGQRPEHHKVLSLGSVKQTLSDAVIDTLHG